MSTKFRPQESYEAKMREAGCEKVSAWVPSGNREELLQIAKEMREEEKERRAKAPE